MTDETQIVTPALIDAGRLAAIIDGLTRAGTGRVMLSLQDDGEWLMGAEYGREADDSPMVGAASYQYGSTAREAIDRMLTETRWSQP